MPQVSLLRPGKHELRYSTLIVLGADTTVTIDNLILAKPEDPADAARMLRLLSGRTHRVITGIAVVTATHTEVAAEVTGVRFLTLSDEEIAAYIATGEPMDKAGAYAIQGRAARWIPRITGDYFNVVGLPLALVTTMLEAIGISPMPLCHPERVLSAARDESKELRLLSRCVDQQDHGCRRSRL